MKLSNLLPVFFMLTGGALLAAQSTADEIETLLQTDSVTYGQAARFVLEASEAMVTFDHSQAFDYAVKMDWFPASAAVDAPARLDIVSLLFMKSFDLKGGIFYSLFKTPNYAYKEMLYKGFIQGRTDPAMNVTGSELLFITGKVVADRDEPPVPAAENKRGARASAETKEMRKIEAEQREAMQKVEALYREAARKTETEMREAMARREAMAEEINTQLEEQNIANTSAEATSTGLMIRLSNIQFLADSSELPQSELQKLQEISNILKAVSARQLMISGYTADTGNRNGELRVSRARAQAVTDYLVSLGACNEDEVIIVGHGANFPLSSNKTETDMAENRRVEITILEN